MNLDDYLRMLPRPIPSAGLAFYESEREACLSLDSRKKENYQSYMASSRRSPQVNYLPIKLDIENVSRCNFACEMCVVSTWPKQKRSFDMSIQTFRDLIDNQYGLVEIKLNGLGEPLLQGDEFFEMIRYARERRIWVRITTNGSLLHLRDNYRKLVESDVCEVDISIDGHLKEVFEGIRRGSHFETVIKNVKLLNNYGDEIGKKRTKMWTLVQQKNFPYLESHVELAKELGFDHLVLSLNLHGWGSQSLLERNLKVTVDSELTLERVENLMDKAKRIGLSLSFWNVSAKFAVGAPETLCPWPFERAVVSSDSKVVPCCMVADPTAFHFSSDQPDTPLREIWLSKEYEKFRAGHLSGELPEICKGCYK